MPAARLLRLAASLVTSESYDRRVAIAGPRGQTFAQDPTANRFGITGAIEHAGCRFGASGNALVLPKADSGMLAEAKAMVCALVGAVHLDDWEARCRPDWETVRDALLAAGGII